ncbi:uncharacterized protein EAF01_000633 [Botrytis porri]|uniref:uncharacterized protein n=1 Tax=Botrytis porri TaxID=87229 RepID=UPI001901DD3C|nr:uncharacterized protein EAF01_000633 [Botrytis porri]KAF7914227.1 hypothetical protein EAF01_000633 [Botrytis porri]
MKERSMFTKSRLASKAKVVQGNFTNTGVNEMKWLSVWVDKSWQHVDLIPRLPRTFISFSICL